MVLFEVTANDISIIYTFEFTFLISPWFKNKTLYICVVHEQRFYLLNHEEANTQKHEVLPLDGTMS